MRLFVALPVPNEVAARVHAALAEARASWPRLRWSRPDAWHLTLAFLGEVDEVTEVLEHDLLDACRHAPRELVLQLGGPDRFGHRVLWLGVDVEPEGELVALAERVRDACRTAGADLDPRPITPHLTVARGRGRQVRVGPEHVAAVPHVEATWDADRAVLYRSHLGEGPARYEELASLPFGGTGVGSGS